MTSMNNVDRDIQRKLRALRHAEQEFYQLLTYTGDVDLHRKLAEWERFYNLSRPHGAFNGKAPYEALRECL
jgi:transposase InsO family protein